MSAGRGSGPSPQRVNHPIDLPQPNPAAFVAAANNANANNNNNQAAPPPAAPGLPGLPLPVLVAPPSSLLAGRPRYLPPTLGERKALSMGASSLGTGSSSGSGSTTGGSTPTLHSWFANLHGGSGSNTSTPSRAERTSSRNSAGIPPQLRDLFNAAPAILAARPSTTTSAARASSSSSSDDDFLGWDPFSFSELLRRSHSRSTDDDDYPSARPTTSGSSAATGSSIASQEVQHQQAIERGNQLLDIIYQLCDYIVVNQKDSTSATTRSVSSMLLKFIDAIMAMDQTSVAATVAAHQAAATASAAARATGLSSSDADHFVTPMTPFWVWVQSLIVPSSPRAPVIFGSKDKDKDKDSDKKSSSDSKESDKDSKNSTSSDSKSSSPAKPSSSSSTDDDDDSKEATSVASGRKRRRAASAATAAISRSSSAPGGGKGKARKGSNDDNSDKKSKKKSKVSTSPSKPKDDNDTDEKKATDDSSSVAPLSLSSSSIIPATPEAATELERFTIRIFRTCLALSTEYGGRRTLRHMLELLRLLCGGTGQSHRQRLIKLPVPHTVNLICAAMLTIKNDVLDKLLDRLLFDVDERAPVTSSSSSSSDATSRGLSAQGPTKRTRTGSGSSATAAGGSPGSSPTSDKGDAATAATTCSLRYFLALLLHPPAPATVIAAATAAAAPAPSRSSSSASISSTSSSGSIGKSTSTASISSLTSTVSTINDAAPSTDALAALRTYIMDLLISRLTNVYGRPGTNGYIAGYMTVLLPLVVHTRQFKPLITAIMTTLKRDDIPLNSLSCLLDALTQLFTLLRSIQIDSAHTSASSSARKPTTAGTESPVVKSEPSDSGDNDIRDNGLCTWLVTGDQYATQPAYVCYTCNLTGSKGCCGPCVRLCHAGHDIAYTGRNKMYCDCGSASDPDHPVCSALEKTGAGSGNEDDGVYTTTETITSLVVNDTALPAASSASVSVKSESADTKEVETKERELKGNDDTDVTSMDETKDDKTPAASATASTTEPSVASLESHPVLTTIIQVIENVTKRIQSLTAADATPSPAPSSDDEKLTWLPSNVSIPRMTAITYVPTGSFNFQPPPPPPQGRHGRGLASSSTTTDSKTGTGALQHAAWLSPSLLLIAEAQQVSVFDTTGSLYRRERSPNKVTIQRSDMALISAVSVPFAVCGVIVNPACREHVAVFGKKHLRVLIFDPRGRSAQRVSVELALDSVQTSSSATPLSVLKVEWVPNSQVLLAVTTSRFVKVFECSKDTISPLHYYSPTRATTLKDSTMVMNHHDHMVTLFALTVDGRVLIQKISENFPGPQDLTTALTLSASSAPSSGVSIHWSNTLNRLFVSWTGHACYVITMDGTMTKALSSQPLRYGEALSSNLAATMTGARIPLRDLSSTMNFTAWTDVQTAMPYNGVVGTAVAVTKDSSSNVTRIAVIHQLTNGLTYARLSRVGTSTEKKVVALLDCSPTSEVIAPTYNSGSTASSTVVSSGPPASSPTSASSSSAGDDTIEATIPPAASAASSSSATASSSGAASASSSSFVAGMIPSVMILQDNGTLLQFTVAPVDTSINDSSSLSLAFPPFLHDMRPTKSVTPATTTATSPTTAPRPSRSATDQTIFERAKVVTSMLISGDFNESSEQVRRALSMDQGESLKSSRVGRLYMSIDLPPASRRDEYIVGIRVLVGKSNVNAIPASLRLDQLGRTRTFPRDVSRWYDMPFSYDESSSLLHNESNSLHLYFTAVPSAVPAVAAQSSGSSAASGSSGSAPAPPPQPVIEEHPRIDCLEVYTIPRRVLDVAFGVTTVPARTSLGTPNASVSSTAGATPPTKSTAPVCEPILPELSTVISSSETIPRDKITQSLYLVTQLIFQSLEYDRSTLALPFRNEVMRVITPSLSVSSLAANGNNVRLTDILKRPPYLRHFGLSDDLFRLVSSLCHGHVSHVAMIRDSCIMNGVRDALSSSIASCGGATGNAIKLRELLHTPTVQRALGDVSLMIGNRGLSFRRLIIGEVMVYQQRHTQQQQQMDDGGDETKEKEKPKENKEPTLSSPATIFLPLLQCMVHDDVTANQHMPLIQLLLRILFESLRALASHDTWSETDATTTTTTAAATTTTTSTMDGFPREVTMIMDVLRDLLFGATTPRAIRTATAIQFIASFELIGSSMDGYDDTSTLPHTKIASVVEDLNALRNARDGKMIKYRCDHCGQWPIVTVRWRCQDRHCTDYDLCDDCHRYIRHTGDGSTHRYSHPMERLPIEQAPLSEDKKERIYDRLLVPPSVDPDDTESLLKMAMDISMGREPTTPIAMSIPSLGSATVDYSPTRDELVAERKLIRVIALDLARTFVAHQHVATTATTSETKEKETKMKTDDDKAPSSSPSASSRSPSSTPITTVVTPAARTRMLDAVERLPVIRLLLAILQEGGLSGDDSVTVIDCVARELFTSSVVAAPTSSDGKATAAKSADGSAGNALPASTQLLSVLFLAAATTPTIAVASAADSSDAPPAAAAAAPSASDDTESSSKSKKKKKESKKKATKSSKEKASKKAAATTAAVAAPSSAGGASSSREDALEKILARAAARAAAHMGGSSGQESVSMMDMFLNQPIHGGGDDDDGVDSDDEDDIMASLAAATGLHPSQLLEAIEAEGDDDDDDDDDDYDDDEERPPRRHRRTSDGDGSSASVVIRARRSSGGSGVIDENHLAMLEQRVIDMGLASGPAARVIARQVAAQGGRHLPGAAMAAAAARRGAAAATAAARRAAAAAHATIAASGSSATANGASSSATASSPPAAAKPPTRSTSHLTEEEQLQLAMAASLKESEAAMDTSSDSKTDKKEEEKKKTEAETAAPAKPAEPQLPPLEPVIRMTLHLLATYPTLPAYLLHVAYTTSHALIQQYVTSPGAFFTAMDPSLLGSSPLLHQRPMGLEFITSGLFPVEFIRQHGGSQASLWTSGPARALLLERVLALGLICRKAESLLPSYTAAQRPVAAVETAAAAVVPSPIASLRVAIPVNVPPVPTQTTSPIPALSPLPPKDVEPTVSSATSSSASSSSASSAAAAMNTSIDDAPSSMFSASTPTTTLRLMSMPAEESQRGKLLTHGQLPSSPVTTMASDSSSSSSTGLVPTPVKIPGEKKKKKVTKPATQPSVFNIKQWEDVLCRIIYSFRITPTDDAARHLAKDLLAALCGSEYGRYRVYDQYVYQQELSRLYKLTAVPSPQTTPTGSPVPLPPPAAATTTAASTTADGKEQKVEKPIQRMTLATQRIEYASRLKLHASFKRIETSVRKRPKNWIRYIKSRPRDLSFLVLFSLHANGGDVIQSLLPLLGAMSDDVVVTANPVVDHAHAAKAKQADAAAAAANAGTVPANGSTKKKPKLESRQRTKRSNKLSVTELISRRVLPHFIQMHLLESSSPAVRKHAQSFMFFLWRVASPSDQRTMMTLVSEWVPFIPSYGRHAKEFIDFIVLILAESGHHHTNGATSDNTSSNGDGVTAEQCSTLLRRFFQTIRIQSELLRTHIDAELYHKLATLYELPDDQYYLATEACGVCHATEVDFKPCKLKDVEVESKYSHSTRTVKLSGAHAIQQIILRITEINPVKMLRTLKVYYNTENVTDLTTFKDKWERWTLAKSLQLAPGQKEIKITLPIPIIAINLLFQYSDCYDSADGSETLKCPRCNTYVATNKHGICPSCRENVYQCRQCRHINYEKLEGFCCPECGYSRFGTFTYHLHAKPSYVVSPVTNETERKGAMHTIGLQSEQLEASCDSLDIAKRQMLHQFDELSRKRPSSTSASTGASSGSAAAMSAAISAATASGQMSAAAAEKARAQAAAQQQQHQQLQAQAQAAGIATNNGASAEALGIRPLSVRRSQAVETMYTKSCKTHFDDIAHSYQLIHSARKELARYIGRPRFIDPVKDHIHGTNCYACGRAFLITAFSALSEVDRECLSNTNNWMLHDENKHDENSDMMDEESNHHRDLDHMTSSLPSSLPVRWSGAPPEMSNEFGLLEDVLTSSMNPDVAIRVAARSLLCMIITSSGGALAAVAQQLRARMQAAIANPSSTSGGVATTKTLTHSMRIVMALFELDPTHSSTSTSVNGSGGSAIRTGMNHMSPPLPAQLWETRLKLLMDIFYFAVEYGLKRPDVAEEVLLPSVELLMNMLKLPAPRETKASSGVPSLRITRSTSITQPSGSSSASSSVALPMGSPKLVESSPAKKQVHRSPSLNAAKSPSLSAAPSSLRASAAKRSPAAPRKSPATAAKKAPPRSSPPPLSIATPLPPAAASSEQPVSSRSIWLAECERTITDLGLHREAAHGRLHFSIDYNNQWQYGAINGKISFDDWLASRQLSLSAIALRPNDARDNQLASRTIRKWRRMIVTKKNMDHTTSVSPFALSFADNSWLARLLLCSVTPSLRSETAKLVRILCNRPMELPVNRAAIAAAHKEARAKKKAEKEKEDKKESKSDTKEAETKGESSSAASDGSAAASLASPPLLGRSESGGGSGRSLDRIPSTDSTAGDEMDESIDDMKLPPPSSPPAAPLSSPTGEKKEKERKKAKPDDSDTESDDDDDDRPLPPLLRTPSIVFMFLELFVKMLRRMDTRSSLHSEQFFNLFHYLLNNAEATIRREYVVIKGIVPVLVRRINDEVAVMDRIENTFGIGNTTASPTALSGLASLLADLVATPSVRSVLLREGVPQCALNAFLKMRGLVLQRSRETDECAQILQQVVKSVFSNSDDDKRAIFKAYIGALDQSASDKRTIIFILEQICQLIKPERPERHCLLHLKKAPTQEDLIPGTMKKNPYSSKDFEGPLMLHVKNKILRDLGIDGGPPVDLLVNNRIINFDLPIIKVYDKVWRSASNDAANNHLLQILQDRHANQNNDDYSDSDDDDSQSGGNGRVPDSPMVVTYRLTGLDGEATEDKVDTLPDDAPRETDPEKEFAVSSVVQDCDGLRALLSRLAAITDFSSDLEYRLAEMLIKTLGYCCKLQTNRRHLLALEAPQPAQANATTATTGGAGGRFVRTRSSLGGAAAAVSLLSSLPAPLSFATRTSSAAGSGGVPPSPTAAAAPRATWTARDVSSHCLLSLVKQLTRVLATKSAIELGVQLLSLIAALLHQAEDDRLEQAKAERVRRGVSGDPIALETKDIKSSGESKASSAITTLVVPTPVRADSAAELDLAIAAKQLNGLLATLTASFIRSQGTIVEEVMHVVPSLTFGQPAVTKVLLDIYQPHLNMTKYDTTGHRDSDWTFHLTCLCHFAAGLNTSPVSQGVRTFLYDHRVTHQLMDHLKLIYNNRRPTDGKSRAAGERVAIENSDMVDKPSLPFVLRLLTGFVRHHRASQQLGVTTGLIEILHQIEDITSSKKVGPMAESLLEAMMVDNDEVQASVAALRRDKKDEKKKLAMAKREAMLKQMGFARSSATPTMLVAERKIVGLDQLADHNGLTCMVCQEGEDYKPKQIMGCYVFCKEVVLDTSEEEVGVTTVTHFNVVHFQCHKDAAKADKKLKPPKTEWEGATIRNSHTLCNNLFPIWSPTVQDSVYAQKVQEYWSSMSFRSSLQLTRYELMIEDMRMLLARFAYEENFAEDSHGGGRESNMKFIPFMVQMAAHLYKTAITPVDQQRLVSGIVNQLSPSEDLPASVLAMLESEQLLTSITHVLVLFNKDQWSAMRMGILKRLVGQVARDYIRDDGIDAKGDTEAKDASPYWIQVRPLLLYWALVDSMMNVFVKPRSYVTPPSATATASSSAAAPVPSASSSSVAGVSLLAGGKRKLDQIEEAPAATSATATTSSDSKNSSTSSGLTRSVSLTTQVSAAEASTEQRSHVTHTHDMDIIKELDGILRTFVDELLPCTSEQELFDVIGILSSITADGTTTAITYITQHFDAARAAAIASS